LGCGDTAADARRVGRNGGHRKVAPQEKEVNAEAKPNRVMLNLIEKNFSEFTPGLDKIKQVFLVIG